MSKNLSKSTDTVASGACVVIFSKAAFGRENKGVIMENPFKIGDEVQLMVPLSSKIGTIIEIKEDGVCVVDWGLNITEHSHTVLDYVWD